MAAISSPLKICLAAALSWRSASPSPPADEPTPAALELARAIIVDCRHDAIASITSSRNAGRTRAQRARTRPELKDSLHATLLAMEPEFDKTEEDGSSTSARGARQSR